MRDELRRLHKAVGSPSKEALKSHADAAGHAVGASTLIAVVSPTGKGRPRLATVEAFVDACLSFAAKRGHVLPEEDKDKRRWIALAERGPDVVRTEYTRMYAEARHAYLERLRERFGRIDTEALLPLTDQDEPTPVPLREVFVPQHVRADPPPMELPRELMRRLLDSGEIPSDDLPGAVDRERILRARQAYRRRPARPVLDVLAEPGGRRVVILGDPGAGKSTLARYLALTLADREDVLPLLIELRQYAGEPFVGMIDRQWSQDGLGLPGAVLDAYLRHGGPALVVFDGLDELFVPRMRHEVADRITAFAARHPRVQVVVTSRVIGYRRAAFDAAGFSHHMLQELDSEQVERFASGWYGNACRADPAEASRRTRRLLDAIASTPAVRELAGNPLLLTILAIIARRAELPRDRRTAYEHAVTVLVEHWEVNKSLAAADPDLPRLDRQDKLDLLRLIARRMQNAESGLAGNQITGAELLESFRTYLAEAFGLPPGRARLAARAMLDQFRSRNFILSRFGGEVYGFVHRAFLEYLAASDIARRFDDRELSEDDLVAVFGDHWRDPAWHEVLLLLTGMKEHFAGRIVDFLLSADPGWRQRVDDLPHHALLAIRCLGEVRKIGLLSAQSDALTDTLIALLEAADLRQNLPSRWRSASEADRLTFEIWRAALPALTTLGSRWPGRTRYHEWYRRRGQFLTGSSSPNTLPSDPPVITAAMLGASVLVDEPAFGRLLFAQATSHQNESARVAALIALADRYPSTPEVIGLVREQGARDPDEVVRSHAVRTLHRLCPERAETREYFLERAADDPSSLVRSAALSMLADGWPAEPSIRATIRQYAVGDPDPRLREHALDTLAATWPRDAETRALLVESADDGGLFIRDTAVRALTVHWRDHPETLPLLRKLATAPQAAMRVVAMEALCDGWPDDPETLPLVTLNAERGRNATVRSSALRLLASRWANRPETLLLLRRCAAASPELAVTVVPLIAEGWPDEPATLPWLRHLATDHRDPQVRLNALTQLAVGRREDAGTYPLLHRGASSDEQEQVRVRAIHLLAAGRPDDQDLPDLLRSLADSDNRLVRQAALVELVELLPDRAETMRLVQHHAADPIDEARVAALRLLANYWPGHPETSVLVRRRFDDDVNWFVRETALRLLAGTGLDDPQVRETVRNCAFEEPDALVRRAAVEIAATLWHDDPEILRLLHAIATDHDDQVCRTALHALAVGWRDDPATLPLVRGAAAQPADQTLRKTAEVLLATCWP